MFSYELKCRECQWRTVLGVAEAVSRLRLIGLLRREEAPEDAIVAELLTDSAPRMTCPVCKEKRLFAVPTDVDDGLEWFTAVLCENCRQPIDPERIDAIPHVKHCATCQRQAEAGMLTDEPDYCPQCGGLVELRVSRSGGITRYKRFCTSNPPCRL